MARKERQLRSHRQTIPASRSALRSDSAGVGSKSDNRSRNDERDRPLKRGKITCVATRNRTGPSSAVTAPILRPFLQKNKVEPLHEHRSRDVFFPGAVRHPAAGSSGATSVAENPRGTFGTPNRLKDHLSSPLVSVSLSVETT
jgi:hypothetical protein